MIGDGQGIAVLPIAQQKFAFVVGAPQFIGMLAQRSTRGISLKMLYRLGLGEFEKPTLSEFGRPTSCQLAVPQGEFYGENRDTALLN